MIPRLVSTIFFTFFIWWLFRLDRDENEPTTSALWIPIFWMFIGCTRNFSEWFHLQSGGAGERYMEGSPVDRAVLTLALFLGVAVLFRRAQRLAPFLRASLPILLYFAYCGVSVLWSQYPEVAGKRWFRSLGDVVMVLVVLTEPNWSVAMKRIYTRLGFVLIPLSILFSRFFPEFGRSYSHAGKPYWTGVTVEKNALGVLTLVFGLASLYFLLEVWRDDKSDRRKKRLLARALVIAMALYLLIGSESVTALASFGLAAFPMILTFRYGWARRPVIVHTVVFSIILVTVSALFLNVGSEMVQGMGRDTTLTGRTRIWHSVLAVAESPLVGTGFESFWIGPRYEQVKELAGIEVNQAHNGYLETYLNLGWIGVGFMGIVLFAGYARIVKAVRNLAPFASLRVAFFMIIITENFTEASFGMAGPVWIAFLLSAMAPMDAAVQPEPEPDQERLNRIEAPWLRKPTSTTPLVPVGSAVVPHTYRAKPQRTRS